MKTNTTLCVVAAVAATFVDAGVLAVRVAEQATQGEEGQSRASGHGDGHVDEVPHRQKGADGAIGVGAFTGIAAARAWG